MFGVVPKALWAKHAPPDEKNRILLAMRPLVVRGARTMLIDAGLGGKEDREVPSRSTASIASRNLDHTLAEAGLTRDDIDIVLATHLHFDHAGGFTARDADGPRAAALSRARSTSCGAASGRTRRTRTNETARAISPTTSCRSPRPACCSWWTTTRRSCPACECGGRAATRCTIRWSSSNRAAGRRRSSRTWCRRPRTWPTPWIMGYDLYPMDTLASKKAFCKEAIEKDMLVFFEHDPAVAAGTSERRQTAKRRGRAGAVSDHEPTATHVHQDRHHRRQRSVRHGGAHRPRGADGRRRRSASRPARTCIGTLRGKRVAFLARHGVGHRLMPSELNFRANIFGFKVLGVERILSASAVGSLQGGVQAARHRRPRPVLRSHEGAHQHVLRPWARRARRLRAPVLRDAARHRGRRRARRVGATVHRGGTYVNMEGPQFSTLAESRLYRSWGMDVIGMTNLQEAKLAREAEICYTTLALVTDYDCWHPDHDSVTVDLIIANLTQNAKTAQQAIAEAVGRIAGAADVRVQGRARDGDHHAARHMPEQTQAGARANHRQGTPTARRLTADAESAS